MRRVPALLPVGASMPLAACAGSDAGSATATLASSGETVKPDPVPPAPR